MDEQDVSSQFLAKRTEDRKASALERLERLKTLDPNYMQNMRAQQAANESQPAPKPDVLPAGKTRNEVGQMVDKTNMTKQLVGGAFDAVNETFQMMEELDGWLKDKVGLQDTVNIEGPLPTVDPPQTTAQGIGRNVTKFLTGFAGAGKLLSPIKAAGPVAQGVKAAAQGAITDFSVFDPHEERLSNLVQEVPALQNPVTEYLAADPTDGAAEGRFKNALEGLGIGAAVDGMVKAVRGLRAVAIAKKGGSAAADVAAPIIDTVDDEAFRTLGDVQGPAVVTQSSKLNDAMKATDLGGVSEDFAAKGLVNVTQKGTNDTYVNFARIETGDDVKSVMAQMADAFAKDIDEARRGVMAQEETLKLADELGLTVEDLLSRRKGQTFNAETAIAARRLWIASGEKLTQMARKVASPNASDVDRFAFRKMLATHKAIQEQVISGRTETARSQASWNIPLGGQERAKAIEDTLAAFGGADVTSELAKRIALLGDNPKALAQMVEKGVMARTQDAVRESFVMGLLWNPKTHIVNMSSNTMVAFQQIYERWAAEGVSQLVGRRAGDGIAPGEAGALFYGMTTGIADAFRNARTALKEGMGGYALGKVDIGVEPSLSAKALGIKNETLGKAVDYIGTAVRTPGRFLTAEDEFFKTIGYRMELHAQAYRQAYAEGLFSDKKAFGERVAQIVQNPPENIRMAASDAALYNTFTNKAGQWGETFSQFRNKINLGPVPLGAHILPFVRTPTNIFRYAMERSPLAPLVSQWTDDIAAGGARADLATARMATGSSIMLLTADWAANGMITGKGPDDPGEREALLRQGWRPYSIKLGDKYHSYNRTDPLGMTMGLAADMQELSNRYDIEPEEMDEWNEIVGGTVAAVANSTLDKTYMTGVSDVVNAISDPDRYAADYLARSASSYIPAGSLAGAVENIMDPTPVETMKPLDYMAAKIPGFSSKLSPKRNLWGEPLTADQVYGAAYDAFSPVAVSEIKESPIDKEIVTINMRPERIKKKLAFSPGEGSAVNVNFRDWPEVYDAYVRLSGNELKLKKYGNKGLKDYLNEFIKTPEYKAMDEYKGDGRVPSGFKEYAISKIITEYRKAARAEIMRDPKFSEFQDFVRKKQLENSAQE